MRFQVLIIGAFVVLLLMCWAAGDNALFGFIAGGFAIELGHLARKSAE